jgi:hypothetical protein
VWGRAQQVAASLSPVPISSVNAVSCVPRGQCSIAGSYVEYPATIQAFVSGRSTIPVTSGKSRTLTCSLNGRLKILSGLNSVCPRGWELLYTTEFQGSKLMNIPPPRAPNENSYKPGVPTTAFLPDKAIGAPVAFGFLSCDLPYAVYFVRFADGYDYESPFTTQITFITFAPYSGPLTGYSGNTELTKDAFDQDFPGGLTTSYSPEAANKGIIHRLYGVQAASNHCYAFPRGDF